MQLRLISPIHLHLILSVWLSVINNVYNENMIGPKEISTILQGELAKYAPWQARLLADAHDRTSGYCGGTLIDNSHVLTALHCVCSDPEYSTLSHTFNCTNIRTQVGVVLGDNIISVEEGTEVYAMCSQIVLHPRGVDVAVCELDRNVSSTPAIKPIKLPPEEPPPGATVKATGWGSTDINIRNTMVDKLRGVTLMLGGTSFFAHELCAEETDPLSQFRRGAWLGDSGGPVVLNLSDSWYLVGVVSVAAIAATASASCSTFVNVYTQKEWILSITTRNDTCPESGIVCEYPETFVSFQKSASQQRCVIQPWLCDHFTDCVNGEDEEDSVCNATALLQRSSMTLFDAARQGHDDLVLSMLDAGLNVNSQNIYNYTALHYAAVRNEHALLLNLLIRKADIAVRTYEGNTALILATLANSRETALELIRYEKDINAANDVNLTALYIAVWRGDVQLAGAILSKGALPNVVTASMLTPLILASFNCNPEMVRLLTLRGADINFGSPLRPLQAAFLAHCTDKRDDVLGLLLQRGANPNALHNSPLPLLHLAVKENNADLVRAFLKRGADANAIADPLDNLIYIQTFIDIFSDNNSAYFPYLESYTEFKIQDLNVYVSSFNRTVNPTDDALQIRKITVPKMSPYSPLQSACLFDDQDTIRPLLEYAANSSVRNILDQTLLMTAVSYDRLQCVSTLLEFNPSINATDRSGRTALHYASVNCTHAEGMQLLLQHHADVDAQDKSGLTPLMGAAGYSNVNGVQLLLQYHADVDVKADNGWTALHHASTHCNSDIVRLMLDHGIDVNVRDVDNNTALHLAAYAKCTSTEVLLYLLQHHADVDAQDKKGWTPLMWAAKMSNVNGVHLLLQYHADVDVKADNGWTALHHASSHCNFDIVQLMLDHGIDVNVRDIFNNTALHLAAYGNCTNTDILLYLLQHHADVDAKAENGWTALHHASVHCNSDFVRLLLDHDIDANARDIVNNTALHLAAYANCTNMEVLLHLLQHHADVDAQDNKAWTPLMWATKMSNVNGVQLLLQYHADVDAQSVDGMTPLMRASNARNYNNVMKLLQFHADPNVRDKDGNTALHYAALRCASHIVTLLLEHSMQLNVSVALNRNQLSYFAHYNCSNVTSLLVIHDALSLLNL